MWGRPPTRWPSGNLRVAVDGLAAAVDADDDRDAGGRTDVDEMALVCAREHTLLHEYGWALERDPDRPGLLRRRPPDRRPPIPARHTLDRDPGHKHALW